MPSAYNFYLANIKRRNAYARFTKQSYTSDMGAGMDVSEMLRVNRAKMLCDNFKSILSHKDVQIHFVGAWYVLFSTSGRSGITKVKFKGYCFLGRGGLRSQSAGNNHRHAGRWRFSSCPFARRTPSEVLARVRVRWRGAKEWIIVLCQRSLVRRLAFRCVSSTCVILEQR